MEHTRLFILSLALLWFFLYWVFGGTFFSILALTNIGRIHRARFGCFFTLMALACGAFAAWAGFRIARPELIACERIPGGGAIDQWISLFTCGLVGIGVAFLIGGALLLIIGVILLTISTRSSEVWIGATEPTEEEEEKQKSPIA